MVHTFIVIWLHPISPVYNSIALNTAATKVWWSDTELKIDTPSLTDMDELWGVNFEYSLK